MSIFLYPIFLVGFWYVQVASKLLGFLGSINSYILHLLSVPILFRTLFKPLKNEYRKGLIVFSVVAGIVVKIMLILFALFVLLVLLILELIIMLIYFFLPFILYRMLLS